MINNTDFAYELYLTKTYSEAFSLLDEYTLSLGYESVSYSFIPKLLLDGSSVRQPIFSVSDNFNHRFLNHYTEAQLYEHDYIINSIKKGCTSTLHWYQNLKHKKLTRKQGHVLNIMKNDYQIENGLTIPTATDKGIAGVSVTSDESDRLFEQLNKENYIRLFSASNMFHGYVMTMERRMGYFAQSIHAPLTVMERQVLKHLLHGLSVPKISVEVHRSRGYIEKLVRSIRIKIGGEDVDCRPLLTKEELIHLCGKMYIEYDLLG